MPLISWGGGGGGGVRKRVDPKNKSTVIFSDACHIIFNLINSYNYDNSSNPFSDTKMPNFVYRNQNLIHATILSKISRFLRSNCLDRLLCLLVTLKLVQFRLKGEF